MHGFDLICHIGLCSAEQQAVFHVALYGGDQLVCNAVRDLAGGTFGKAAVAGTVRDFFTGHDVLHEGIHNGTSRHTYRTFYNGNVVLCGVDQGFFQPDVCVTFFRWDKTGGNLNAVHTKIKDMLYILVRGDAAGSYYRDFRAEFCGIAFYSLDDLSDLIVVGFRCIGIQLFLVEAQMTACLGTLDHHKVCSALVLSFPVFQDNLCRFVR